MFCICDHIYQHFHCRIIFFLTQLIQLSVFIWLDIVYFRQQSPLFVWRYWVNNTQLFEFLCHRLLFDVFKWDSDSHFSSCNLVSFLKQFYALKRLLFRRLIGLNSKVNVFQSLTDNFEGKSAFSGWMNTFFNDYFDDIGSHVVLLELSLFIGDLKFTSFENDLDDLFFGFVGKELVEIGFFGDSSMRGILIDFLCL